MKEIIIGLLEISCWPMERPQAYGCFHICFMLIGFELCAILAWIFKDLGEKGSRILLGICGGVLLISELYKQLLYGFCVGEAGYDWSVLPFQLCSLPMYLCIISAFMSDGPLRRALYSFMGFFNLLGGAISFFEPSGLLHSYWTLTLHSCIWHMMLVFVGLWLCISGKAGREKRDYFAAVRLFLIFSVLAFCINLALRKIGGGAVNMFFLGPTPNPIIVFSWIAEHIGWAAATAVYIPAVCFGSYIVFRIQHFASFRFKKYADTLN